MYKHYMIDKLKKHGRFTQQKSKIDTQISLLELDLANARPYTPQWLKLRDALCRRREERRRAATLSANVAQALRQLTDQDREILDMFYVRRQRCRYSALYLKYNLNHEGLQAAKTAALVHVKEEYFKVTRGRKSDQTEV